MNGYTIGALKRSANPVCRARMSASAKRRWLNDDGSFRDKISRLSKERLTEQWKDKEFRNHMLPSQRMNSRRLKSLWTDNATKEEMLSYAHAGNEAGRNNPKTSAMRSRTAKKLWANEEFRQLMADSNERQGNKNPNKPEKKLYAALRENHIKFVTKKSIMLQNSFTVPDAFVPSCKLAIYTDGEYWHGLPYVKKKDKRIRNCLRKLGYRIFVIDQAKNFCKQFDALVECVEIFTKVEKFRRMAV